MRTRMSGGVGGKQGRLSPAPYPDSDPETFYAYSKAVLRDSASTWAVQPSGVMFSCGDHRPEATARNSISSSSARCRYPA